MKYLSVLLMLFFQYCIANPIPEDYRLQYTSRGDGVHNGRYAKPVEGSVVLSYYKKGSNAYVLRAFPNRVRNLYMMVGDSEELILSIGPEDYFGDYLVDLYEEGDVFSILLQHSNGYTMVVFEYVLDSYEQKASAVIVNFEIIGWGKDVSIKKIKFINPYEVEILKDTEELELYSLITEKVTGLSEEDMSYSSFLVRGELPSPKAMKTFKNRKSRNVNSVIVKRGVGEGEASISNVRDSQKWSSWYWLVSISVLFLITVFVYSRKKN